MKQKLYYGNAKLNAQALMDFDCADAGHAWTGGEAKRFSQMNPLKQKLRVAQPSHIRVGFPGLRRIECSAFNILLSNLHNRFNKFIQICRCVFDDA